MAPPQQVKRYIASWLQLGRKIMRDDSSSTLSLPSQQIATGDRYTQEFEDLWQQISTVEPQKYYLEGTDETIDRLLAPSWEIVNCSLCNMLVPLPQVGLKASTCPCHDIPTWPNNNLPIPNGAIDSRLGLQQICGRLVVSNSRSQAGEV